MTYARCCFLYLPLLQVALPNSAVAEGERASHYLLQLMQDPGDFSPTNRIYLPACPLRIGRSKIYAITDVAAKANIAIVSISIKAKTHHNRAAWEI